MIIITKSTGAILDFACGPRRLEIGVS